ncbi:MAG: very short patch repair endonuclease [Verrucomicrobia bacterium]|nr:very short patch repair endonuclease [Verrucomicrobiota bacterium]
MSDIFSKRKRSAVMAAIRSRGNRSTEARLVAVFRTEGITGWRRGVLLQWKTARGNLPPFRVHPDFVFRARKLAVFVDGCFWHGCPIHGTAPKQHAAFWRKKIADNRTRDRLVTRRLRARGWRVLRLWEHELARKHARRLLARLHRALGGV